MTPAFTSGPIRPLDVCTDAEETFAETIMACEGDDSGLSAKNWRILVDGGTPVAITKKYGAPSTLSLVRVMINGVPYPEGSILRMGLGRKIEGEGPRATALRA